jgi:hypothetical protein
LSSLLGTGNLILKHTDRHTHTHTHTKKPKGTKRIRLDNDQ